MQLKVHWKVRLTIHDEVSISGGFLLRNPMPISEVSISGVQSYAPGGFLVCDLLSISEVSISVVQSYVPEAGGIRPLFVRVPASSLYDEFTRLAETRLAQIPYINLEYLRVP